MKPEIYSRIRTSVLGSTSGSDYQTIVTPVDIPSKNVIYIHECRFEIQYDDNYVAANKTMRVALVRELPNLIGDSYVSDSDILTGISQHYNRLTSGTQELLTASVTYPKIFTASPELFLVAFNPSVTYEFTAHVEILYTLERVKADELLTLL